MGCSQAVVADKNAFHYLYSTNFIHQFILLRGPLGVVIRGSIRESNRFSIFVLFSLRALTFRWSLALWKGLLLGIYDSLTGQNGHQGIFKR